jgi:hypothetical protein
MLKGADLSAAYASADIFMMPSETETLGFVALEAMASGLPVVAVAAGGLTDIITHPGVTSQSSSSPPPLPFSLSLHILPTLFLLVLLRPWCAFPSLFFLSVHIDLEHVQPNGVQRQQVQVLQWLSDHSADYAGATPACVASFQMTSSTAPCTVHTQTSVQMHSETGWQLYLLGWAHQDAWQTRRL